MTTLATRPVLRVRDLCKVHGTGEHAVTALDRVNLDLPPGTFTAVMGPSGSGKSTFLTCAAGLDAPTSGVVEVAGHDLGTLPETRRTVLRRDRFGFVFQAFNLVATLTAAQNVELPARLARRRTDPDAVAAALEEVGLADRARHRPAQLSGGQQQRVAIARALLHRPDVLFADEPTGALDTATSRQVLRLLRRLVDRDGRTTVMVSHDPAVAAWADAVVLLADGRVADHLQVDAGDPDAAGRIAARLARVVHR